MNNWKVIFATMLIFGTGVVTGGLLVRHADRIRPARFQHPPSMRPAPQTPAGSMRLDFLRRVQRELDLTPEQRERVDAVLKEGQERTRILMEPITPRIREELQRTKQEFRAVLNPEQRAKFDELVKHQQRPHDPRQNPTLPPRPPAGQQPVPQPAPR